MQPKVDFKGSLFEKVFGKGDHIEDMPTTETTPEFAKFRNIVANSGDAFTAMVYILRETPDMPKEISKLASLLWNLVGNRITPVVCGPNVPSIHFWAEVPKKGKPFGAIVCPPNWLEMLGQDIVMQFGAIVFAGSQARDFYNERLYDGPEDVRRRSWAYESEYLHHIQKDGGIDPLLVPRVMAAMAGVADFPFGEKMPFVPTKYQQSVMEDFPLGLTSLEENLRYESKPFEKPT